MQGEAPNRPTLRGVGKPQVVSGRGKGVVSDEDLSLMKAVADQVSVAMVRMRDEEAEEGPAASWKYGLRKRTAELQDAYDKLMRETEELGKVETATPPGTENGRPRGNERAVSPMTLTTSSRRSLVSRNAWSKATYL